MASRFSAVSMMMKKTVWSSLKRWWSGILTATFWSSREIRTSGYLFCWQGMWMWWRKKIPVKFWLNWSVGIYSARFSSSAAGREPQMLSPWARWLSSEWTGINSIPYLMSYRIKSRSNWWTFWSIDWIIWTIIFCPFSGFLSVTRKTKPENASQKNIQIKN